MKNCLILPHGEKLINLMIDDPVEQKGLIEESTGLAKIKLSTLKFSDLIMLGIGAFSPLEGFMVRSDYGGGYREYEACWRYTLATACNFNCK